MICISCPSSSPPKAHRRGKLRPVVNSALVRFLTLHVSQSKLTGRRLTPAYPMTLFKHCRGCMLDKAYRWSTLCTAEVCWRATFFLSGRVLILTLVMPVRWILQFYILSRNVFMVSVFQVYFQKGKVLQDSGFVGDALQLFLQCLALDEDFLPAKLEVERVILFMKLDYYLWLDSFIKLPLW